MARLQTKSENYEDFVKKFKPKKTTDDCYTPDAIMDIVNDYVEKEYLISKKRFKRPFYPGGDYENENYDGCVVVDNPPFSILKKIVDFYDKNKIPYFLFAPGLTCFYKDTDATCIHTSVKIKYANGAIVNTSFLTNLDNPDIYVKTDPELKEKLEKVNIKKEMTKIDWPDTLLSPALMDKYTKKHMTIKRGEFEYIKKHNGRQIYGLGLLLKKPAEEYIDV